MVCRNKGRADAAKDEIVERSKNQVRNKSHEKSCHLYFLSFFFLNGIIRFCGFFFVYDVIR